MIKVLFIVKPPNDRAKALGFPFDILEESILNNLVEGIIEFGDYETISVPDNKKGPLILPPHASIVVLGAEALKWFTKLKFKDLKNKVIYNQLVLNGLYKLGSSNLIKERALLKELIS